MSDIEVNVGRDTERWGDRGDTLLGFFWPGAHMLAEPNLRHKAAFGEGGTVSWRRPESATSMTTDATTSPQPH